MAFSSWDSVGEPNTSEIQSRVWELYHENSKLTKYNSSISPDELREKTLDLLISQSFKSYSLIKLPEPQAFHSNVSLWESIKQRETARALSPTAISLEVLSNILYCAYGETRSNEDTVFPHPFRTVPSAGALYPLEIYFHHNYIEGIETGLYHYNPHTHDISLIKRGDQTRQVRSFLIQPEISINASMIVFISALFERSAFKYGERCYRFAMLEAGHVSQNINLSAFASGLGTVNIGGFLDNRADDFLGLDGVSSSCIYMCAIGQDNKV